MDMTKNEITLKNNLVREMSESNQTLKDCVNNISTSILSFGESLASMAKSLNIIAMSQQIQQHPFQQPFNQQHYPPQQFSQQYSQQPQQQYPSQSPLQYPPNFQQPTMYQQSHINSSVAPVHNQHAQSTPLRPGRQSYENVDSE